MLAAIGVKLPCDALGIAARVRPRPEERAGARSDRRDQVRAGDELARRVRVGREGDRAGSEVGVPTVLAEGIGSSGESVLTERDEEGGTIGEGLECGEGHVHSLAVDAMNPLAASNPF